jgi:alpha-glucosidase
MLAFRKASALRGGRTRFLDVGEPLLAFQRGEGEGALLCLFNLSPVARSVTVSGVGEVTGPSVAAVLTGDRLRLGPNAAAFLTVTGVAEIAD